MSDNLVSNNKISHLISSQVPFFVRNDHPNFIAFLEAYYRFLEQENETLNQIKLLKSNIDIDQSIELFLQKFYDNYLKLVPKEIIADKTLLVKHVKQFYRSRGTENSIRFLMRLLFNEEISEFYYPKRDVLRASDGKWFIEKSVKVRDIKVNGVANDDISVISYFTSKTIKGNTSNATAVVERADSYYDGGLVVNELKISNQFKTFGTGETIFTTFVENGVTKTLTANLFAGSINTVELINRGTGYSIGDSISIESNTGTGGVIIVSSVTTGNLRSVFPLYGGAGFQANTFVLVSGGGGSGANANILSVQADSFYHPNSYNLVASIIALEANTPLNNAVYSNLSSSNVNTSIANAVSFFTYANTGPIQTLRVLIGGNNFTALPTVTAQANTIVRSLGILGRMEIINGGEDYQIGDQIVFTNVFGGYGYGANANVTNVDINGTITEVKFYAAGNEIIGGTGYNQSFLPLANVSSNTGANAQIVVTAVLGEGENLRAITDSAGSIQALTIVSRGQGYEESPTLNLTSIGDGTAQAVATVITGTFTYPGRYINDDGHISGYNFLQNRDYYQDFSYVIKMPRSIEDYRKPLRELVHPAGMKVFGEYIKVDNGETMNARIRGTVGVYSNNTTYIASYTSQGIGNTSNVTVTTTRDTANLANVFIEFDTGSITEQYNDLYVVNVIDSNTFSFNITSNSVNTVGTLYYSSL
jgi:hypothetical protein